MTWDARIRRRLKLRDLDTLLAVADCGSMAKAAVQLSVSQPSVSKSIADMEHTLGVQLLAGSRQQTADPASLTPNDQLGAEARRQCHQVDSQQSNGSVCSGNS